MLEQFDTSVDNPHNGYTNINWENFEGEAMLSKLTIKLNNGYTTMLDILSLMVHKEMAPSVYEIN